jgi:hypothetical protein
MVVAEAVYGPVPEGYCVHHLDENKSNNIPSNLEYKLRLAHYSDHGKINYRRQNHSKRIEKLREGLAKLDRSGENNSNFGNLKGEPSACLFCEKVFYAPPCKKQKYCSSSCYNLAKLAGLNHKVVSVDDKHIVQPVVSIQVEPHHNYAVSAGVFVSNSQIEMRVMAHISQDPAMLKVFREDGDIHAETVGRIFGIWDKDKQDDYKHRLPAKTCGFGILNLISPSGLSRELIPIGGPAWTVDACAELLDKWFKGYPGVRTHLDNVAITAKRYGFIYDIWGRRELLPQMFSTFDQTVEEGIRIACNQQIQAGAQGIFKEAMRNIWQKHMAVWVAEGICFPLIQIHDDLVTEVKEEYTMDVLKVMKWEMENAVASWFSVPVKVEMKQGRVWGAMQKVKEVR